MKQIILDIATAMLVVGNLIHALNFAILKTPKMSMAMVLLAAAMYCLFTK